MAQLHEHYSAVHVLLFLGENENNTIVIKEVFYIKKFIMF